MKDRSGLSRDAFRADAKAGDDLVVLGGYKMREDGRLDLAPWFSEALDWRTSPWIYKRSDPYRVIASLELPASLGCVKAFLPGALQGSGATPTLTRTTDNKGNSHLPAKLYFIKHHECDRRVYG